MDMTGERRIEAPRQAVWQALNDPAVLKASIPGCETLEKLSDTDMKATAAVKILDEQFAKKPYAAGNVFSMGDIPIAIMCYRYRELVPERPPFPNFERWYAAISTRPAFRDHVSSVPLT